MKHTKLLLQLDDDTTPVINNLTRRDIELLRFIAQDLSNQEIADNLKLSLATVKKNISDLLVKLDMRDRVQLAVYAVVNGFIEKEELNL
ncbi:MAG TPA: LuxR C-terminal-related transcriptional regulator [Bacillota bacterium]|nr:LuxR C-terminal-related transcriptional regulator [Bacillota bacterium]